MVENIHITFKKKFLAGLFVTIPAAITIFVLVSIFDAVDGLLRPVFEHVIGRPTPGLGFVGAVVIVFIIGIISTNVFGKKVLNLVEKLFLNIPVFRSIYTALKQMVDAFSPENKGSFKQFVIAEYPRQGAYSFGFLTKECSIRSKDQETCLKAVYIPTNHLYLGEIVLLDDRSIIYTDISIEDGIKLILSGGIAAPSIISESGGSVQ